MTALDDHTNRRHKKRQEFETDVTVHDVCDDLSGDGVRAISTNLSTTGMGLVADRAFLPGHQVVLTLNSRQARMVAYLAEVQHCRPVEGAGYMVGLAFRSSRNVPWLGGWTAARSIELKN